MDERRLRRRVGVVVFAAVIVTVILVVLFGLKPQFLQPVYTIKVGFPRAPGVSRDTPIRKNGVPIGRVSDVMLRDEGDVVLTMRIDKERTIRRNEQARISTGSLVTGDAVVEFVPDETNPKDEIVKDGDFLPSQGVVAGDPLEVLINMEDRMTVAFESIQQAGNSMSRAFGKIEAQLDNMLDEEQIQRIAEGLETALNSFTDVMTAVEDIVGDPQLEADVKALVSEARPVLSDARRALTRIEQTADTFTEVGQGLNRNLENVEELTEPLGEKGAQLISKLEETATNADRLIDQLTEISRRVNSGQGTLGRLATDEQMYEQIVRSLANIEYLTKKLRPVIDDVRIITDKVARDPGSVGVPGLLNGNQGGIKRPLRGTRVP